jgi:hypothetical protein
MTTKLVSMNLGCRFTIEVDGQQKDIEFSVVGAKQPHVMVGKLVDFIMTELEMSYLRDTVPIAKPIKIKAQKPLSHKAFLRRIKKNVESLGYKE